MRRKVVSWIMLTLILVGVLNAFPTVAEDGVDTHENQIFNGDHVEPFSSGEDLWNFSQIIEWSRFAYVNNNSAEVVVGLRSAQLRSRDRVSSLTHKSGGKIVNTVSMGGKTVALVVNMSVKAAPSFVESVRATGLTKYVEPNIRFYTQLAPNDPYWSLQWGPQEIEAHYAWDTTVGDASVLVAVIDTGIDYNHSDLVDNYVALGYDWVNDDADPMDDHGHGTHCAGIVAATINNGIGIAGVAQVRIMAEKGLGSGGSGSSSDLADAIVHAVDQGADILSNSWGSSSYSNLIHDAVKYARDNGVLVVAAAGNEASSMKHYPGSYDEVVAVTATDQSDEPASFTSYGKWVDVGAPGVDIYSTVLNDGYGYKSGTSMACPHVAGVAALIWSEFPSLTRDEVRLRLRVTADDLGDPGFDVYYGYGRVNARRAVEPLSSHDLLILNWKRPAYVEPGSSGKVNTTVVNFGSSSEAGITVQLRANGSVVDSAYISSLGSMKSVTVSCSWSPTVEGRYHVKSYVVPVSGETVVENNVRSAYINVRVGKFIRVPEDCSTIQEAVDSAGPGETIKVASGTYFERVGIDVSLKLVGEGRDTTVIDGNGIGIVVGVTADNVEVRGFTVQNSGRNLPRGGIVLLGVKNCVVSNNTLINDFEGVLLWECNGNNSVYNNIAISSGDAGVGSVYSTGRDTISDNAMTGGQFGVAIVLDPGDPNKDNRENAVSRNVITNSEYGICICADDNTVVSNNITLSSDSGVWLCFSGNTLRDNRVEKNERGVLLQGASSNKIYHNDFIHNTIQVYFFGSADPNTWDDGYPSGGNYWSDYNGVDADYDGIGDTTYVLGEGNIDRFPLIHPWVTPFYGPVAKFTHSPETPWINETVTFNAATSASGWNGFTRVSIASYMWDFGDGNVITVTHPMTYHAYVAAGTYTVNLTVTCQDPVLVAEGVASDSTWKNIKIASPPPPSGPTARFSCLWPPVPCANDKVTFDASASASGWNGAYHVRLANYTWNFDDGNTTTTTNSIIEHTYAYNRTYTVNLTVTCQDDPVLIAENLTSDSTWKNITIRTEYLPPSTQVVFQDDFEDYDVGTFPYDGGWELWRHGVHDLWEETKREIVGNTPTKSLTLSGYDYVYPIAAKRIDTEAPDAAVIGFEVWVKLRANYYHVNTVTRVGFLEKKSNTSENWYGAVRFTDDMKIIAGGQFLQEYRQYKWYKVRVVVDRLAGKFSVWIDDVLRGENLTASGDLSKIEAFGFAHCHWGQSYWTRFDGVKFFATPKHDVGITKITSSFAIAEQGCTVPINVTVANQGNHTETFNVTAYYDSNAIETKNVTSLAPYANITLTFNWNTTGISSGAYVISAEASSVPGEYITTNNTYTDGTIYIYAPIVQTSVHVGGTDYPIKIETNVTTTNVVATRNNLIFSTSGPSGATGYINTTIPAGLNKTRIQVFLDGEPVTPPFQIITTNGTHYFIYFEFTLSTHDITIQYAIADIAVTNVEPSQTIILKGNTLSINVTIENQGNYTETFNVTVYANTTTIATFENITLQPGGSTTLTFDWNTTGFAKGVYTMSATAATVPDERDTSDNTKNADSMVTVLSHDVATKDITLSKTIVGQGHNVAINVTVENQGSYAETFNVTIYANTTVIATFTNISLASENSITITFTWNTTGFAKGVYTISANATIIPGETDTSNNSYIDGTVRVNMVGDITPEFGIVDIVDIVYLAVRFGAEKGEAEYEPNADVNGDGIIDIVDIVTVALRFGETDP